MGRSLSDVWTMLLACSMLARSEYDIYTMFQICVGCTSLRRHLTVGLNGTIVEDQGIDGSCMATLSKHEDIATHVN